MMTELACVFPTYPACILRLAFGVPRIAWLRSRIAAQELEATEAFDRHEIALRFTGTVVVAQLSGAPLFQYYFPNAMSLALQRNLLLQQFLDFFSVRRSQRIVEHFLPYAFGFGTCPHGVQRDGQIELGRLSFRIES